MPRRRVVDPWLVLTAAGLLLLGTFMVASASQYVAMHHGLAPAHYLWRRLAHLALGAAALAAGAAIPYERLSQRWLVMGCVGLVVLALVGVLLTTPIGGARRWFRLGAFNLQPSEAAKLAVVLFMARLLSRKERETSDPWAVPVPAFVVVGTIAGLVMVEPDLGTAVLIFGTAFAMLFVAGLPWRYVGLALAAGVAVVAWAIAVEPYRLERVWAYLDPEADALGSGFQVQQARIAIGNGGLWGVGLGQGQQKALYLPEPHTDFIYAVMAEELGVLGGTGVLAAFLLLGWRGLRAARRAPDRFGFYLALGITVWIVGQGLVHMGVCLGVLPTKGLPLPFISYGGSSLLATMAGMGLLLNVSQHAR